MTSTISEIKVLLALFTVICLVLGTPMKVNYPKEKLESPRSQCGQQLKRKFLMAYPGGMKEAVLINLCNQIKLCEEILPVLKSRVCAH